MDPWCSQPCLFDSYLLESMQPTRKLHRTWYLHLRDWMARSKRKYSYAWLFSFVFSSSDVLFVSSARLRCVLLRVVPMQYVMRRRWAVCATLDTLLRLRATNKQQSVPKTLPVCQQSKMSSCLSELVFLQASFAAERVTALAIPPPRHATALANGQALYAAFRSATASRLSIRCAQATVFATLPPIRIGAIATQDGAAAIASKHRVQTAAAETGFAQLPRVRKRLR